MMILTSGTTGAVMLIAQRSAQTSNQQNLRSEFRRQLGLLLESQETRHAAVKERCQSLAKSVRIRAALDEDDVEDLYENAAIELRELLPAAGQPDLNEQGILHANFCRFLNAKGEVLSPKEHGAESRLEPWEKRLGALIPSTEHQQAAYLDVSVPGSRESKLEEVISTPVIAPETKERVGTVALGFQPLDLRTDEKTGDFKNGILFEGRVYLAGVSPEHLAPLAREIAKLMADSPQSEGIVHLNGDPYLLFHELLNHGSALPPAHKICLYPMADWLAQQRRRQWQIIGIGLLVLLTGLAASHWISARLSKPVEQLAADSANHSAKRVEAEAARELTEQKYRSIFENAVEGIFILSAEGRYLSANPALAHVFGYGAEAELLSAATEPGQLYVKPALFSEFLQHARGADGVKSFQCEMRRKDGRRIWISQNARAIRDAEGAVLHFEGTLEDVTERKADADTLREMNLQLGNALSGLKASQQQVIQQERLRALGEMASGIAHDFNNALMPIIGFSELLLLRPEGLGGESHAAEYLEIIHTGARDASKIVARLREFYREKETHEVFAPVNLDRIVEQSVSLTRPKWKDQAQSRGANITVRMELGETAPVSGDESALREALTNLIFNAVDAMPCGGTLTLQTRSETEQSIVEISDTGTGMTEAVRERCLDPFFSTKGERGTGLGLSMVFGIVQRHLGGVDIRTTPGAGTTFVIRLPQAAEFPRPTEACDRAVSQRPLHVLVVDDEPQVREVLVALLSVDGHTVETASHGLEGIQRFRHGHFDVVLTDKAMPGMSGDQMAATLKETEPGIPIILLSGFSSFLEGATIPGIDVLATKPISLAGLRGAIERAMKAA